MRLLAVFLFLPLCSICEAQSTKPIAHVATIDFSNQNKSDENYPIRSIYYHDNDESPLYVSLGYERDKIIHYEFFRVDSSRYLVHEYFKESDPNTSRGLKSFGEEIVSDKITDSVIVSKIDANGNLIGSYMKYLKRIWKDGEWVEYEDEGEVAIHWVGFYKNNKRVGLWRRIIDVGGGPETHILQTINYDIDSTKSVYTNNKINAIAVGDLKKILTGRWLLGNCEDAKRMNYYKCELFNGAYGDDCNNRFGKHAFYQFNQSGKFVRQAGDGCHSFEPNLRLGSWRIKRVADKTFIEVKFNNRIKWQLDIVYLDDKNALVTGFERQLPSTRKLSSH